MPKQSSIYYKVKSPAGLEALYALHYNLTFPAHYHQTYNISLVYEGSFHTEAGGKFLTAPAGSILITNPEEIHANPFDKNSSASFFTFYVPAEFLKSFSKGNSYFDQKVIYDNQLFRQLNQSALQIRNDDTGDSFQKQFGEAIEQLTLKYAVAGPVLQGSTLALFNELLSETSLAKFSLEEAAKRFGMDKYKFLRLFKSQTGLTPNNYFILKRIEKSKSMLLEGRDLLSIAVELDFYDAAHFSKHFKKFTGITPMAYSAAR